MPTTNAHAGQGLARQAPPERKPAPISAGKPSEMTRFAETVIADFQANNLLPSKLSELRRVFRILIDGAGIARVRDLDDEGVRKFESAVQTAMPHVHARVQVRQLWLLRMMCSRAVELGILAAVPKFPPHRSSGRTARPISGKPSEMTAFADKIVSHYVNRKSGKTYVSQVRRVFHILIEDAGITRIRDLNNRGVRKFERAARGAMPDVVPRSYYRMLRILHKICVDAVKLGLLASVPKFPPMPQMGSLPNIARTDRLTEKSLRLLLAHLSRESATWEGLRLYCLVALLVHTGLYPRDALGLRVEDVELANNLVRVPRRMERRTAPDQVHFPDEVKAILQSWLPQTGCPFLFPGVRRLAQWSMICNYNGASPIEQLQRAGAAVGLPSLTFQMLRRFFRENNRASLAVLDGAVQSLDVRPSVQIRKRVAFIRGKPKGELTPAQHQALCILLKVWPDGLSMKEMDKLSRNTGWHKTLRRLREDPEWESAIKFPGVGYPGMNAGSYGIAIW